MSHRTSRDVWWTVLGIMVISLALECWVIPRDLPYASEVDEPLAVRPALHIAATGDLNPHWFGHPASSSIYPLAGLYHVWDAVSHGGPLFSQYRADGVRYLVTNAAISGAYRLQPGRYPTQAAFYRQLLQASCLLQEFRPNTHRYGPIIRIYELMPVGAGCTPVPVAVGRQADSGASVHRQLMFTL